MTDPPFFGNRRIVLIVSTVVNTKQGTTSMTSGVATSPGRAREGSTGPGVAPATTRFDKPLEYEATDDQAALHAAGREDANMCLREAALVELPARRRSTGQQRSRLLSVHSPVTHGRHVSAIV